jgi:hypothetical protein
LKQFEEILFVGIHAESGGSLRAGAPG